ncbi:MAG: hypothetical protein ACD_56C00055G0011 [uncultured bacterium]|nr:MAG: hypothetical protein ACD_56C00055G0011 [uncultured bacterium]
MDEILLKEQKKNEKAKHRIIGLTLETRPDYIDEEEIVSFRNLGCTRVELGVQSIYDDVLELNKRGHLVSETIRATKLLKDAGFKINFHMMPGLPGSTPARDFKMFKQLFESQDFQPDMLKIYPTVVLKDSILYNMWKKGQYKPLSNKTFEKLVLRIKNETITPYVRIARLVRDVPTSSIIAGPTISNLRQIIIPQSKCPCIRCREVREGYLPRLAKAIARRREAGEVENEIILDRIDYTASDGKEIFLQYVSKKNNPSLSFPPLNKGRARVGSNDASNQKLFALLRLRIPSIFCHSERNEADNGGRMQSKNLGPDLSTSSRSAELNFAQDDIEKIDNEKLYELFPVLKNSALIREVHTYGKLTQIDKQNSSSPQHIGLGKKLLIEAERISKEEFGLNKIVVISGVGVRGYYKKSGYKLRDTYMVKSL